MKRKYLLLILLVLFSLALAAPQAGTRLAWFLPLTGSGGQAASASSQASFTIGQSATGSFASPATRIGLGFWQAETIRYRALLPVVKK